VFGVKPGSRLVRLPAFAPCASAGPTVARDSAASHSSTNGIDIMPRPGVCRPRRMSTIPIEINVAYETEGPLMRDRGGQGCSFAEKDVALALG
jgi:hypothetical protein